MNRFLVCFLIYLINPTCCCGKGDRNHKRTAVFGGHDKKLGKQHSDRVRIFLDREGNYYPFHFRINDKELRRDSSSLAVWYRHHPGKFRELCARYMINTGTVQEQMEQLNEAIALELAKEIDQKSSGKTHINFYIHGFNKKAWNGDFLFNPSSRVDNKKMRKAIGHNQDDHMPYVEVYWDANKMSAVGSAIGNRGYKLFAVSTTPSAERVGLSLRRLFLHMADKPVNIITHSTGALVACELLFNASSSGLLLENKLSTPAQANIKACLVAPAIGGDRFKQYLERGPLTIKPADSKYQIAIVYNTNDYILNKNRRILFVFNYPNCSPDSFASTRLGCNYQQDLSLMRNYVGAGNTTFFDLSHKRGKPRICHLITPCYIHNKAKFKNVRDYLLK